MDANAVARLAATEEDLRWVLAHSAVEAREAALVAMLLDNREPGEAYDVLRHAIREPSRDARVRLRNAAARMGIEPGEIPAVPINRLGLMRDERGAAVYVRVENAGVSGYLILKSDYPDMQGGESAGDDWVATEADLARYFEGRQVDWTIPETDYDLPSQSG